MSPTADRTVAPGQPAARADVEVTRSEEKLLVHTERRPYQLVRVRKVIVTEVRTLSVEVRREELRIETVDIDDSSAPTPTVAQGPLELLLHEEEIVTQRTVVPRERVRIGVDVVHEPVVLSDLVRHERIGVQEPPQRGVR